MTTETTTPAAATSPASTTTAAPAAAPSAGQPSAPAATAADSKAPGATAATTDKPDSGTILAPADKAGDPATDASKPDGQDSDGKKPDDKAPEGDAKDGDLPTAEAYEKALVLPEGMEMDKDALAAAVPVLQKYKLPAEAMNELGQIAAGMVSRQMKAQMDQVQKQVEGWHDKTIAEHGSEGEAAFNEKVGIAQKAINKFFDADSRKSLQDSGFGNHPALFKMAYVLGQAMKEDGAGPQSGSGVGGEQTLAEVWYGDK